MSENSPVNEPDFKGEKMKMPESSVGDMVATEPRMQGINHLAILTLMFLALVAILGGLFFWFLDIMENRQLNTVAPAPVTRPTDVENNEPESTTAEARTESMTVMSTSDDLNVIEADVMSTNLNDLELEFNAIEAELDAALIAQ